MNQIEKLQEIIDKSRRIVFFGGAGVSTESGIPDFRSKDGLYNQHDVRFDEFTPEYLLSHDCLVDHPDVFYEFYRQKLDTSGIQPNAAHRALAALEKCGKLTGIITQNIDGLHQRAGSRTVAEIHGTTVRNYCMRCHKKYPADAIFTSKDAIPRCSDCGGMIRPDVTLYGESLPEDAWNLASRLIREADCLIIGGTSLAVAPASYLVYQFSGDTIVILNRDATPRDGAADLVIRDKIGEVLSQLRIP